MCIIIENPKGSRVGSDILLKSSILNPHGLGVTWLDTYETEMSLSSEWSKLQTDRPYIAHFRYATVGDKSKCHPFPIGDTGCVLYQNGSVWNLGSATEVDAEHMARILNQTDYEHWQDILEMSDCRWVVVDTVNKSYWLANEDMFIPHKGGVSYSKQDVLDGEIVAVYGTLKRGYSNHSVMGTSKFVGSGRTMHTYPMVCSGIPFVLPRRGEGHNVKVELFMVDKHQMQPIDSLEGHPHNYIRRKTPIRLENGDIVMAWLYFYPHDHVDTGVYEEEFTRGYNPNYTSSLSSTSSYVSTHYGEQFDCDCESRGSSPVPHYDEWDSEWYCQTCLGRLDNLSNQQKYDWWDENPTTNILN